MNEKFLVKLNESGMDIFDKLKLVYGKTQCQDHVCLSGPSGLRKGE